MHAAQPLPGYLRGWFCTAGLDAKPEGYAQVPVRNRAVLRELRRLRAGRWKKVIKQGNLGEVHYFEHESGSVAGVKFFPRTVTL